MLTDRPATMKDLKKGFMFFMEQEKKEIKKLVAMTNARKMALNELGGENGGGAAASDRNEDEPFEWWDDEFDLYRPITEWTLQRNEWLDVGVDQA